MEGKIDWKAAFEGNCRRLERWNRCTSASLRPLVPPPDYIAGMRPQHLRGAYSESLGVLWRSSDTACISSVSCESKRQLGSMKLDHPLIYQLLIPLGEHILVSVGETESIILDQYCRIVWRGELSYSRERETSRDVTFVDGSRCYIASPALEDQGLISSIVQFDFEGSSCRMSRFGQDYLSDCGTITHITASKEYLLVHTEHAITLLFDHQQRLVWSTTLPTDPRPIASNVLFLTLTREFAFVVRVKMLYVLDLKTGVILSSHWLRCCPYYLCWDENIHSFVIQGDGSKIRRIQVSRDGLTTTHSVIRKQAHMGICMYFRADVLVVFAHRRMRVYVKGKEVARITERKLASVLGDFSPMWGQWTADNRLLLLGRYGQVFEVEPVITAVE